MMRDLGYLAFGLVVLFAYWQTARNGSLYLAADAQPSPPGIHAGGGGGYVRGPTFWGTGYQGGK